MRCSVGQVHDPAARVGTLVERVRQAVGHANSVLRRVQPPDYGRNP